MSYSEPRQFLNTTNVVYWTNLIREAVDIAAQNRTPVQSLEIATALERVATEMRQEAVKGATDGI